MYVPARPHDIMEPVAFTHHHRVTYSECAPGNHVYYARYLDILEAARGEMFRAIGQPLLWWQERGLIFPVVEVHLRYHRPARYDETLAVTLWVSRLSGARLNLGCKVSNPQSVLVLEGETFHVCTSLEEKPRRLPAELLSALQPYGRPGAGP